MAWDNSEELRERGMLNRSNEEPEETMTIHRIALADWYATQFGRAVEVYERGSSEPSTVLRPPKSWGPDWRWNVCDEGVYFRRG